MQEASIQETHNKQVADGSNTDLLDIDRFFAELNQSHNERVDKFYKIYRRRRFAPRITTVITSFFALVCVALAVFVANGGFGYSWFRVTSGSMQREIPEGSLVITKQMNPHRLIVNDTVTYLREDGSTVTHNIVDIISDDGVLRFQTKGIENAIPDLELVDSKDIVGLVVYHVAGLGSLLFVAKWIFLALSAVLLLLAILSLFYELWPKSKKAKENKLQNAFATA